MPTTLTAIQWLIAMCPYCSVSAADAWMFTEHAFAIPHSQPVTSLHVIVAPRRHVGMFYDLDVQEQQAVWNIVVLVRRQIASWLKVERFYIGFADAPGSTGHAHVHVIPQINDDEIKLPEGVEWVRE